MKKELVRDIILILIVVAGLVSFFYQPEGTADSMKYLQTLMGGIVGWFTGLKAVPIVGAFKK